MEKLFVDDRPYVAYYIVIELHNLNQNV